MAALTETQLTRLNEIVTLAELRNFVSEFSVAATKTNAILYSGHLYGDTRGMSALASTLSRRSRATMLCALLAYAGTGVTLSVCEEIRRSTYDGIPLDEPILIRMRETLLRVPAGYLLPWPARTMRGRTNDKTRISIEFWMPDKRYPEISPLSRISSRPREPGRQEPPADAYVVRVNGLKLLEPDELKDLSPETQFRNLTSSPTPASYTFEEEQFGLVRFWRHDWPHP
jgi:hypothetical protein